MQCNNNRANIVLLASALPPQFLGGKYIAISEGENAAHPAFHPDIQATLNFTKSLKICK
jgi:hypothetical protein